MYVSSLLCELSVLLKSYMWNVKWNLYLFLCSYETKKSQDLVSVMRAREVTRWCRYSREVMRVDVGLAREVTGVVVGFAREVMRWWCICVPEMVLSRYGFVCVVRFDMRWFCIKKTKSVCVFCVTRWCLSNSLYQVIKTHISLALYKLSKLISSHQNSYQVIKIHISLFLISLITTNPFYKTQNTNRTPSTNPFYKTQTLSTKHKPFLKQSRLRI